MHRTVTLDFGIVHEGEIHLELDNGEERALSKGDVVVQCGTIHAWHNKGDQTCRIYFVLSPSKPVVVNGVSIHFELCCSRIPLTPHLNE
jgi:quercetin dioxygenase-like cupin family protein